MLKRYTIFQFYFLILIGLKAYGQFTKPTHLAEIGTTVSSVSQTPFWLRTNQYGIVPFQAAPLNARVGIRGIASADTNIHRGFTIDYGLEIAPYIRSGAKILIPEAFLQVNWNKLSLYVGRQREVFGLADSTLSSGSYGWSGTALPMPKIQLSVPQYIPIGFTKNLIYFKGLWSHGWFDPTRNDLQGVLLHQKALYVRVGKPNWAMKMHFGFTHQAQWGGQQLRGDKLSYPITLNSYWDVISGRSVSDTAKLSTLGQNEATNRLGNHLGTLDFGLELQAHTFSLLLYRQSVFEDGSLAYLINVADGLNGVSFQNKIPKSKRSFFHLKKIVAEIFYSKSQGGSTFNDPPYGRGADNYFNNLIFTDGWSYFGKPIGTPFISSTIDALKTLPTNNNFDKKTGEVIPLFTNNNRVLAYYLGISGIMFRDVAIEGKFSWTHNMGTFSDPFPEGINQFSMLIKAQKPIALWQGVSVIAAFALDNGKLYDNNIGGYIAIRTTLR